jgi:TonB-dependent SusC/RagA subfamily outer membrane receptor
MPRTEPRIALSFVILVTLLVGCARAPEPAGGRVEPASAQKPTSPHDVSVTAEDVQRTPSVPIEQLLAGKIAGVVVNRTDDGGITVRIRGTSSFNGSNEPLYILDGVPIQAGPNGSLHGVNPNDIASIKVLKDPADLTMYGSRGANGVIVIKTKQSH